MALAVSSGMAYDRSKSRDNDKSSGIALTWSIGLDSHYIESNGPELSLSYQRAVACMFGSVL